MKTVNKNFRVALCVLLSALIIAGTGAAAYGAFGYAVNENSVSVLSRLGSTGTEVRNIQTVLKRIGLYYGAIDGIYGTQTKNAVTAFQKNCGITVDGIAGPVTLLYLGLGGSSSANNTGYTDADVQLLAKVISGEARGESYEGQVAVGAVVLNRVAHPSFPDSISGVVYQSGAFSCVYDSNWYQPVAESAKRAAKDAINGWDPSGGALYYYNPAKTSNRWMLSRPIIKVIGHHRFCI